MRRGERMCAFVGTTVHPTTQFILIFFITLYGPYYIGGAMKGVVENNFSRRDEFLWKWSACQFFYILDKAGRDEGL